MSILVDSYSGSSHSALGIGTGQEVGQSFFCTNEITLEKCSLNINYGLGNGGVVAVKLYAHSGNYGDGVATGQPLAISEGVTLSTLNKTDVLFYFSSDYKLQTNTPYVIALAWVNAIGAVSVNYINDSPAHAGNFCFYNSGWSNDTGADILFSVYGKSSSLSNISSLTNISQLII